MNLHSMSLKVRQEQIRDWQRSRNNPILDQSIRENRQSNSGGEWRRRISGFAKSLLNSKHIISL